MSFFINDVVDDYVLKRLIIVKANVQLMVLACGLPRLSDLDLSTVIFDGRMYLWDLELFDILRKEFTNDPNNGVVFFQSLLPGLKTPPIHM